MVTKVQTKEQIEQEVKITQLEGNLTALATDLASSVQREKEASQENIIISNDCLRLQRKLDGFGKEKTASIILQPGQLPAVFLTGWWSDRDLHNLHRPFSVAIRMQKKDETPKAIRPFKDFVRARTDELIKEELKKLGLKKEDVLIHINPLKDLEEIPPKDDLEVLSGAPVDERPLMKENIEQASKKEHKLKKGA